MPRAPGRDWSALARRQGQDRRAPARQRQGLCAHRARLGAQARHRGDPGPGRWRDHAAGRKPVGRPKAACLSPCARIAALPVQRRCRCHRACAGSRRAAAAHALAVDRCRNRCRPRHLRWRRDVAEVEDETRSRAAGSTNAGRCRGKTRARESAGCTIARAATGAGCASNASHAGAFGDATVRERHRRGCRPA